MTYTAPATNQTGEPDGFTVHTPEGAPEDSRETLAKAQEKYGFVPNCGSVSARYVLARCTDSSTPPASSSAVTSGCWAR